jgi:hypothetical protein
MKMTDLTALAEMIKPAILNVWDQIGSDVMALVEDPGEIENDGAIEMCVDADRLRTMGGADGAAADDMLTDAHAEHGWDDVIKALTETINLV